MADILEVAHLDPSLEDSYDLVLATLGYESRCTYIPVRLSNSTRVLAVAGFEYGHELGFEQAEATFRRLTDDIQFVPDSAFQTWLRERIDFARLGTPSGRPLRVAVDVSSMTRQRVADIVRTLGHEEPSGIPTRVDFYYALAEFSEHAGEQGPIAKREPVHGYVGWTEDPELPSALILGLGYEQGIAAGLIEFFEARTTWLFIPRGPDHRYLETIRQRNPWLDELDPNQIQFEYDPLVPIDIFRTLGSLCEGALRDSRPLIVPLGPKTFALAALLAAEARWPRVPVWRVSPDDRRSPVDRSASGHVCGLRVSFGKAEALPADV